ncbi:hypothetical protein PQ455_11220 [Sphingomonas naphthae]|uniref:Flippase-like domain-containing protein n=1 Tax=Sphingomonas naphthae TaxID=1813468 RepID=A0ABY7TG59_9SPHN|nr:hypothetical protein [Sphingomonas naphthae]WCT72213.1 hypothetical protein PQ455_11220 [Sphingomonas naphthae]
MAADPSAAAGIVEPASLIVRRSLSQRLAGPIISLAVLAMAVYQIGEVDPARIWRLMPAGPAFWLLFMATYLAPVAADWLIFRRLWRIPASGVVPLLRKYVGNEILLGYIGEVYFYAWARRRSAMVAAPFGAIKDVAVTSALAGNGVTLVMLALAAPFYDLIGIGANGRLVMLSIGVILATSLAAFVVRKRLFALDHADIMFVSAVHVARILIVLGLSAAMWHIALPVVALPWWLLLATVRMLLSRLPLVPNKDVVFAGLAVFLVGHDGEISALMALMGSLMLTVHILLGIAASAVDLLGGEGRR